MTTASLGARSLALPPSRNKVLGWVKQGGWPDLARGPCVCHLCPRVHFLNLLGKSFSYRLPLCRSSQQRLTSLCLCGDIPKVMPFPLLVFGSSLNWGVWVGNGQKFSSLPCSAPSSSLNQMHPLLSRNFTGSANYHFLWSIVILLSLLWLFQKVIWLPRFSVTFNTISFLRLLTNNHLFGLYYFLVFSEWVSFFSYFLLLFHYSCPHFSPITLPRPTHPWPPTFNPFPIIFDHGSFIHVPWLDPSPLFPIIPLLSPLWLLLVCSLFPCLWFYFSCLFVLLIRFHL